MVEDESKPIHFSAEDEDLFNSARLLILFQMLDETGYSSGANIERIAYYDFFSAQPFLVFGKDDSNVKLDLLLQGFESTTIGYISSSQRFANRRERLRHYLAGLLMRDLILVTNSDGQLLYSITDKGRQTAGQFKSLYITAYRKSATFVIDKLARLSDKKLAESSKQWLRAEAFMVDLYDF